MDQRAASAAEVLQQNSSHEAVHAAVSVAHLLRDNCDLDTCDHHTATVSSK